MFGGRAVGLAGAWRGLRVISGLLVAQMGGLALFTELGKQGGVLAGAGRYSRLEVESKVFSWFKVVGEV